MLNLADEPVACQRLAGVKGDEGRMGKNEGKIYLVLERTPIFACKVGQNSSNPDCTHARCINCYVEAGRTKRNKKRKERGCCHDMAVLERYWESAYFNEDNYRLNEDKHMPTQCVICAVKFYDRQPQGRHLCDNDA